MNNNIEYWSKRYRNLGGKKTVGNKKWTNEEYINEQTRFESFIYPYISKLKGDSVLDFGCGIGRRNQFLKQSYSKYYGVDIVKSAINSARRSYHGDNFELITNNNIPFKNIKFDLIWTNVALQHIVDEELLIHYINQFKDLLSEEGHVLIVENTSEAKNNNYISFRKPIEYINLFYNCGFEPLRDSIYYYDEGSKEPHLVLTFKKIN